MVSERKEENFIKKLKENYGERFEYRKYLDKGGYSHVYVVFDHEVKKERVIKEPRHKDAQKNYRDELEVLGGAKHPNIMEVYEVLEMGSDKTPHLLTEYIKGSTLRETIDEYYNEGTSLKLSWMDCVNYMIQLCEGLKFIHAKGQCVRDIKPDNLIITEKGLLKITDFGSIYKVQESPVKQRNTRTRALPCYSAPELLERNKKLGKLKKLFSGFDHRIDIYSTGIVFYELMSFKLLFEEFGESEMIQKKKSISFINSIDSIIEATSKEKKQGDISQFMGRINKSPNYLNFITKKCILPCSERYKDAQELEDDFIFSFFVDQFETKEGYNKLMEMFDKKDKHSILKVPTVVTLGNAESLLSNLMKFIRKKKLLQNNTVINRMKELEYKMKKAGVFDYKKIESFILRPERVLSGRILGLQIPPSTDKLSPNQIEVIIDSSEKYFMVGLYFHLLEWMLGEFNNG